MRLRTVDDQPLVKDSIVEAMCCYGSNLIPKESLAERLASSEGQLIPARSALHEGLLEKLQAEKQNSSMEWGHAAVDVISSFQL